ncbi:MAG: hypothetical protein RL722_2280 [Pseudomonadota bacterium]|jgi:hypothetical protein
MSAAPRIYEEASNPIRVDLASVTPMYYPIVEQARFGSVKAMCRALRIDSVDVQTYIDIARVNCSDVVPIPTLFLGNPDDKRCAVLVLRSNGSLVLFVGLFAEASESLAEVDGLCREMAAEPLFCGREIRVAEFRGNPKNQLIGS